MKSLLIATLFAGAMCFSTGCATVGYSGGLPTAQVPPQAANGENANNIFRGWFWDNREIADDVNSVFLLQPGSRLTPWHLR